MLFRALTTCAGKHSFQSGETVDLPEADAAELVSAGALLPLEVSAPKAEPEAEAPAPKAESSAPAAKSPKK
jgi:hypothetical protein